MVAGKSRTLMTKLGAREVENFLRDQNHKPALELSLISEQLTPLLARLTAEALRAHLGLFRRPVIDSGALLIERLKGISAGIEQWNSQVFSLDGLNVSLVDYDGSALILDISGESTDLVKENIYGAIELELSISLGGMVKVVAEAK
jgi:hypothetical protein